MTCKPIETFYKGCRFRSRLEARWAVYFDAMGIDWEYEKQGYTLDGIRYLPDFWLPFAEIWAETCEYSGPGIWVEIKNDDYILSSSDKVKFEKLVQYTKHRFFLFIGSPGHIKKYYGCSIHSPDLHEGEVYEEYTFSKGNLCMAHTLDIILHQCQGEKFFGKYSRMAIGKAIQAQFEFTR